MFAGQVVGGAEEASRGDLVGGTQAGAAAVGAGAAVGHVEAGSGVGVGAGAAVRGCMAVGRLRMAMATDLPVATVTTGTAMDVPTMAMDMERRSFLSGLGDSASGGSNTLCTHSEGVSKHSQPVRSARHTFLQVQNIFRLVVLLCPSTDFSQDGRKR
jgi:hypothetical protein